MLRLLNKEIQEKRWLILLGATHPLHLVHPSSAFLNVFNIKKKSKTTFFLSVIALVSVELAL